MENSPENRVLIENEALDVTDARGEQEVHHFRFSLGSQAGTTIVVAEEVSAEGAAKVKVSDQLTIPIHLEVVNDPTNKEEVDAAVDRVRKLISNQYSGESAPA